MTGRQKTGQTGPLLGSSQGIVKLQELRSFQRVTRRMAEQAVRTLEIFTFDLDPMLYDQKPFLKAAKKFALSSHHSRIEILLQNNERAQREGHRLVDLARRLPSRVEIRVPHPDFIDHGENFLVADATGFVRRSLYGRYEGEADFNNRLKAGSYNDLFRSIWERSEPDSELRRLDI